MENSGKIHYSIRGFRPTDGPACKELYLEGGQVADTDTGADIQDIQSAYMRHSHSHFWVAESAEGLVVGMVGVQQHDQDVGEIRRFRVAAPYRRQGIGGKLMETVLRFCQENGYLKVKLDTFMDAPSAVRLFERFRFLHDHTKTLGDRQLMYFYFDLYSTGQALQE